MHCHAYERNSKSYVPQCSMPLTGVMIQVFDKKKWGAGRADPLPKGLGQSTARRVEV